MKLGKFKKKQKKHLDGLSPQWGGGFRAESEELIYCFKTAYHSTVQFPLGSVKRFGEFQILEVW